MTATPPASTAPTLVAERDGGGLRLRAGGSWIVAHVDEMEKLISNVSATVKGTDVAALDLSEVGALDTFGSLILLRLTRPAQDAGKPKTQLVLRENMRPLLQEVHESSASAPPAPARRSRIVDYFESIGRGTVNLWRDLIAFAEMLGALCAALLRIVFKPTRFRLTSAVHQLDRVAWQAVPIILLITFLIGGIIAQQGFFHFRKFGADAYVVDMVGILVLREIGVLIVAIMVAGRSGSSYTAELGSMKMREEIDALQTMGLDPIEVLVLPRMVALVIALPILTFLGSISALYGAELVAWFYGGMSPEIFLSRLHEAISLTHFKVGMIKAPFMALVIGIVACTQGMRVKGSAESLGLQTTASVVKAIFLVIVLDGLFAIFFAAIDM